MPQPDAYVGFAGFSNVARHCSAHPRPAPGMRRGTTAGRSAIDTALVRQCVATREPRSRVTGARLSPDEFDGFRECGILAHETPRGRAAGSAAGFGHRVLTCAL